MKYNPTNIIGDAGEHLVASRIIKTFGYPCRLTNIDIGIDAEIEIIDGNYKSTGELIKCQIKTTYTKNFHLYIDGEHINYWNMIKIPVVVFLVHLESEEIYWHCISSIDTNFNNGSSYRIDFNQDDILNAKNKVRFKEISIIPIKQQIQKIYNDSYKLVMIDNEFLETDNYDLTSFEDFVLNANKIKHELKKADRLLAKNPSLNFMETENHSLLSAVYKYLSRINEEKAIAQQDHGHDHFDHLESDRFNWD